MAVVLLCVRERERVPLTRGTRSLSLIVLFVSFLSHLYSENQMPIENNVKAMFNSLNTAFAQAQPDNGMGAGGWWPAEGQHEVFVSSLNVRPSEYKLPDGQKVAGTEISFRYQLINDTDSPNEPRSFDGSAFRLPQDTSVLDDKGRMRVDIEMRRLKGHLQTILRRDVKDIGTAIADADAKINGQDAVAVVVKCQYDNVNGKIYRKDFLVKPLAG